MRSTPLIAVTATTAIEKETQRVSVNAAYVHALAQSGAIPLVLPPRESAARADEILDAVDALLLTGGEDVDPARYGEPPHPLTLTPNHARDDAELALVSAARARRLPLLAICRGLQLLNVAHGGTLVQDIGEQMPAPLEHSPEHRRRERVHDVKVERESRLARALGAQRLQVNSVHHQAARDVGEGLRVVARAADGVIEGLEWSGDAWWAVAVQWHPEELVDTAESWDRELFAAFVREAAAHGRD